MLCHDDILQASPDTGAVASNHDSSQEGSQSNPHVDVSITAEAPAETPRVSTRVELWEANAGAAAPPAKKATVEEATALVLSAIHSRNELRKDKVNLHISSGFASHVRHIREETSRTQ